MISLASLLVLLYLATESTSKLAQVVSLSRHGSRYPLNSLYDGNDTRYTWGELTSTGHRNHQNLGAILRREYIEKQGFLSASYNSKEM